MFFGFFVSSQRNSNERRIKMIIIFEEEHEVCLENEGSGEESEQKNLRSLFYTTDEVEAKNFCEKKNTEEAPKRQAGIWDEPWKEYFYKIALPLPA